jgi:hypothetical protein
LLLAITVHVDEVFVLTVGDSYNLFWIFVVLSHLQHARRRCDSFVLQPRTNVSLDVM